MRDRDILEEVAKTHHCPDCGTRSRLAVAWIAKNEVVICHGCGRTDKFVRGKTITQLWRESPEIIPVHIANRMAQKHGAIIEATIEGLPPELANVVRQKYGLPIKEGGE